ncbi:hypothetical protein evm_014820 [Chilo suppressalis]|nr:hypothetical protein evm_014820 [Chilo suppressalis]
MRACVPTIRHKSINVPTAGAQVFPIDGIGRLAHNPPHGSSAARPSPPRNCTAGRVVRNNEAYLSVRCVAGYDGGLSQYFTLDALGDTPRVLVNSSAGVQDLVVWLNMSWAVLDSLDEDEVVAVTARNSKGSSEPVLLRDLVFRDAAKRTGHTGSGFLTSCNKNRFDLIVHQTWLYVFAFCKLDKSLSLSSFRRNEKDKLMPSLQVENMNSQAKCGHYTMPLNVPTAGAQAFPMDGIGRLGHDPPRGPSADWRVLTTADATGTNGLTCLPKHGGTRDRNFWSPIQ